MRRLAAKSLLGLALAAGGLGLFAVRAARADVFEPISLASVGLPEGASFFEQATVAQYPAISGDGRYVAFVGSFGGVTGIWRRDLLSGAIEQVAGGDGELPSISENGQYISFTTNEGERLPAITNGQPDLTRPPRGNPNVYVRDMSKASSEQGAFMVASASSGSSAPLTYAIPEAESEKYGSVASGRSAMSADGRYVAFVTTAASDLVQTENDKRAEEKGEPLPAETPARQVAVRDLQTSQTKLVSVEYENGPTDRPVSTTSPNVFGAVYGAAPFPAGTSGPSQGASISADGSTVAWIGQEIDKQAPVLAGSEAGPEYVEPLWRRIAGDTPEPTRRITGGGDPANPACAASGESEPTTPATLSDPCQGPFEVTLDEGTFPAGVFTAAGKADLLPRLSGNGLTVAFLASQPLIAAGHPFVHFSDDLYVADMADGLTRVEALRRLTEQASGEPDVGGGFAPITDLGVSPDGSEIAFATARTTFPLGSPAYVSPPAGQPEMQELYDIDLANDTLTRVTHGYQSETQQSEPAVKKIEEKEEAGSPSFSADGNTLAFSSAATNLVYGEGNKASSVFVVSRKQFEAEAVQQFISPPPPTPNTEPAWLLDASARSRRDGSVLLEVEVPGAGSLAASAQSSVRVKVLRSRAAGRGARRSRSVKPARTTVASRRVARATKRARGEGLLTLALSLTSSYRALASQRGGLSATVTLAFTAPGHAALRERVPVTFLRIIHAAHPNKRRAAKKARRTR